MAGKSLATMKVQVLVSTLEFYNFDISTFFGMHVRKTGAATPAPGNFNAVLSPIHCGLKGAILDLEKNKWMGNFLFIL